MDERKPCPRADLHTDCPEGYREWHSWAEEMSKTHDQERCPGCERWNIWAPKKRARADAEAVLAAADAVDPMRRRKSGSHRLTDPAELRARLADVEHDAATSAAAVARLYELLADAVVRAETAEAACETSGAALVVMNDLLKEAEADRATLTEALEKIRDAPQPESGWRIARAALAAVKGRET